MALKVRKRNKSVVDFDRTRIENAVYKALLSVNITERSKAVHIAEIVEAFYKDIPEGDILDIEKVQDDIESTLLRWGYLEAAKAYIIYREHHKKLRKNKQTRMDIQNLVGGYLDRSDWRVNENSNSGYSYASMMNHIGGSVIANYTLANIYPPEIGNAHSNGDFHLHDLSCGIIGYCAGWSLKKLLLDGFKGQTGRASAKPAKHLDTVMGQIVNFMGTLQTEWAGAQAFSSFDTYLAPFVRYDKLDYDSVKQSMQRFVFASNIASRWGQTPFTNLTFDWVVPEDLKDEPVIIGGEYQDAVYGDYQKEMDMLNKAFLEIMIDGDRDGRIFTFPIPTYNITRDFNWDSENADLLFKMTGKYGTPYFQNFVNSELKPGDVRSMCLGSKETINIKIGDRIEQVELGNLYDKYQKNEEAAIEFKNEEAFWAEPKTEILTESWNPETKEIEWVKVKRLFKVNKSNYYYVYLGSDSNIKKSICVTEDHPFLINRNESKCKSIKEGEIKTLCGIDCDYEICGIVPAYLDGFKLFFYDIELEKNNYFVHSGGIVSHNCCRLQMDVRQLSNKTGGLFGAGESTGSVGVVTINMPRIGYLSKTEEEFFEKLSYVMHLAKESLEIKRKVVQRHIDTDLLPYTKHYLGNLNNHFNTIGLVGMNEACLNFIGVSIGEEKGREFSLKVLEFMREKLREFQKETGHLYNLEATPAEGTSFRLARIDKKLYPDIKSSGEGESYYTNSTHLPVNFTDDLFEALQHQDDLQCKYNGGTVFHGFIGSRIDDIEVVKSLVKKMAYGFKMPYFTITPTFSICPEHGYIAGEHHTCPHCR